MANVVEYHIVKVYDDGVRETLVYPLSIYKAWSSLKDPHPVSHTQGVSFKPHEIIAREEAERNRPLTASEIRWRQEEARLNTPG